MAIQFRAATAGVNGYSGAQITIPDTTVAGDLLLAAVEVNNPAYTLTPADGWELLATSAGSPDGGSQYAALFTRRAVDEDADQTVTFPVNPTGATKIAAVAAYYTDAAGALVHVGVASWRGETTSGTMHANPVINVAELPAWLVTGIGKKGTTVATLDPPAGYTSRAFGLAGGTSNVGVALADRAVATAGNTAGASWTSNVSNKAATTLLASLYETEPPPPPKVALRRWNGTGWVLAGG